MNSSRPPALSGSHDLPVSVAEDDIVFQPVIKELQGFVRGYVRRLVKNKIVHQVGMNLISAFAAIVRRTVIRIFVMLADLLQEELEYLIRQSRNVLFTRSFAERARLKFEMVFNETNNPRIVKARRADRVR